jgi:hypothetical protein
MDARTFEIFFDDLRRSEHTSARRQQLIAQAAKRHRFTSEELTRLMSLFAKGAERVEVAATLYEHLDDPRDFERVYALLPFESDRKALALRVARGAAAP